MDDLREHLDASIGAGPAHRGLAPLLAAGHRAVRRRRIVAGAGALAIVAVVSTSVAVAAGRPDAAHDPTPTGQTSSTPTPSETAVPQERPWNRNELVRFGDDGELEVRPQVKVLDRVDDYLSGLPRYLNSVALDVMYDGTEHWLTAELQRGGISSTGDSEPSDGWADFQAWVADQASVNGADGDFAGTGYPELVTVRPDGTFAVIKGVDVIDQTTADLPDGFSRAAYVALDGQRYLVMARPVDGGGVELITLHAEPHGDSLDALLAYARDKYASGEGVR